ncbi:MAG: prepilin peptidase [Candidatus Marinimicrobia bacterium]|nr:prepilin peptidase [Candidatus Neomarinimicrobiota bacterium]
MLNHLHPAIELLFSLIGIIIIGSAFAIISNNAVDRITKNQSMIYPGPYCPSCAVAFMWKDLIPIISYLINRGKCPYCNSSIALRHFIVDVMGILWVSLFIIRFGWNYSALLEMLFGMCLIAIIIIELENRVLSDSLLLFMGMLGSIYVLGFNQSAYPVAIVSMVVCTLVLIGYNLVKILTLKRTKFEITEIKLGAVLGIFLGFPYILLCVFLAWLIGAIWGSFNIKFFKKNIDQFFPRFPAFLAISGLIILLFGGNLINSYLNLI